MPQNAWNTLITSSISGKGPIKLYLLRRGNLAKKTVGKQLKYEQRWKGMVITMKNTKQATKFCAIIMVMMMIMMTGCTAQSTASKAKSTTTSKQATSEKNVTVAISGGSTLLNLDTTIAKGDMLPYELMYEPLVKYGKDGAFEPALAEKWEISESGKEYTFHLRKDVKFSDGTNFNADSVLFNVGRWVGKSATASLSVVNEMANIEKIDDHTVKMSFKKSYYPFLTELSYPRPCRMLGANSVATSGDVKADFVKPIGTGPWMLERCVDDVEMVFVPNPHYYGEKPKIGKLVLKLISDPQSRVMALQSGEVDFSMADLPMESLSVLKTDSKLKTLEREGTKSYHLMFNYDNPLLMDLNVRQAVNYAIDKQSIVNNLFDGLVKPAKGILPSTVPYVNDENNKSYDYNLDKAKKLLAVSGYSDSDGDGIVEKDGKPLRLSLVFQNSEYPEWKVLCEMIQSELKKAGIDIDLQLREKNAYYDAIWKNRNYDLVIYRTYEDSWNPHGFLTSLYYKPKNGATVGWYDKTLNGYLDEVLATTDETQRQQKYNQIFNRMYEQAVCVPLYYPTKFYVFNARLTNIEKAPTAYEGIEWDRLDVTK